MDKTQEYEERRESSESSSSSEEEEEKEPEKWRKHYSSKQRILLVGEGDFSFSLSLARAFGSAHNMVASSIDTQGTYFTLLLLFSSTSVVLLI